MSEPTALHWTLLGVLCVGAVLLCASAIGGVP